MDELRNPPLSQEEFIQKYGNNGKCPMQFISLDISEARDEREQVLINNMNWLFKVLIDRLSPKD